MNNLLKALVDLKFSDKEFTKFIDSTDPLYADYHDRQSEKWHDIGFNNGIDYAIRVLSENGFFKDVQNSRDDS